MGRYRTSAKHSEIGSDLLGKSFNSNVVQDFRNLLGESYFDLRPEILHRYALTCTLHTTMPAAIAKPGSLSEVQGCVTLASRHRTPLYPISTGKNWGYGAASPTAPGCIILDLSRLNRIVELDPELAYVVIEPGVTQQQLYEHLSKHAPDLYFDVCGASPAAGLIGNIMERGHGHSSHADRFAHSAGMEVVLANGEVVGTGFGAFDNARSRYAHKWGLGPQLDGIFPQSNFGIVTKLGIWLMRKPKHSALVRISFADDGALLEAIPRLRTLRQDGTLPGAVHISNAERLAGILNQTTTASRPALPAWNLITFIGGSRAMMKAHQRELHSLSGEKARLTVMTSTSMQRFQKIPVLHQLLRGSPLAQDMLTLDFLLGKPSSWPLRVVYREKNSCKYHNTDFLDPARDQCGLLWFAPIVPLTQTDISDFLKIITSLCEKHSFSIDLNITLLTGRSCCFTVALLFDKSLPEDMSRARSCYTELVDRSAASGFYPYRFGSDLSLGSTLFQDTNSSLRTCRTIKQALDPDGIIAPGRYGL